MAREVDLREHVDYVSFTLRAEDLPAGARGQTGSLSDRALEVARFTTEVLGARRAGPPIEFLPEAKSSPPLNRLGAASVRLQQQLRGIPVFLGNQVVRFGQAQELQRTQARIVVSAVAEPVITVTAAMAAEAAVRHLITSDPDTPEVPGEEAERLDLSSFSADILAEFPDLPTRSTVFDKGPLDEPVTASLTWVPVEKHLRLCWDLHLAVSASEGVFRVLIAVDDGTVVYCTQTVPAACAGSVYTVNPDSPRALVGFPRPWAEYGLDIGGDLPETPPPWVERNATEGYSARASLGAGGAPVSGTDADGSLTFTAPDPVGVEQMVVNAFYGVCSMHDFFHLLGFREEDGSYQDVGVTASGRPCTRVNVEVKKNPIMGTAHWWPSVPPAIRFGPERTTGRSTALDMTIVLHEYMHGVTIQLVGRGAVRNPFLEPQSRGMGEGWGDFIACTLTGQPIFGGWVKNDARGMRRFPYDDSFPVEFAHFGLLPDLGKDYYRIGELWCATLLEVRRLIGASLTIQLVVDALRDLPINPSLLDGRDALLLALGDRRNAELMTQAEHAEATRRIWTAFAKFGMGVGAESGGPSLLGVVADSTVPG